MFPAQGFGPEHSVVTPWRTRTQDGDERISEQEIYNGKRGQAQRECKQIRTWTRENNTATFARTSNDRGTSPIAHFSCIDRKTIRACATAAVAATHCALPRHLVHLRPSLTQPGGESPTARGGPPSWPSPPPVPPPLQPSSGRARPQTSPRLVRQQQPWCPCSAPSRRRPCPRSASGPRSGSMRTLSVRPGHGRVSVGATGERVERTSYSHGHDPGDAANEVRQQGRLVGTHRGERLRRWRTDALRVLTA